jgi:hypothetical protein
MTTTDFLFADGPAGTGAGGKSPRRLIPCRFEGPGPASEPDHWTGSLIRIVAVLAVSAAAALGVSLALGRPAGRSVVIAPVHLPAVPTDGGPAARPVHGADVPSGHRDSLRPSDHRELFE